MENLNITDMMFVGHNEHFNIADAYTQQFLSTTGSITITTQYDSPVKNYLTVPSMDIFEITKSDDTSLPYYQWIKDFQNYWKPNTFRPTIDMIMHEIKLRGGIKSDFKGKGRRNRKK